jgi:hypothetical protein
MRLNEHAKAKFFCDLAEKYKDIPKVFLIASNQRLEVLIAEAQAVTYANDDPKFASEREKVGTGPGPIRVVLRQAQDDMGTTGECAMLLCEPYLPRSPRNLWAFPHVALCFKAWFG